MVLATTLGMISKKCYLTCAIIVLILPSNWLSIFKYFENYLKFTSITSHLIDFWAFVLIPIMGNHN